MTSRQRARQNYNVITTTTTAKLPPQRKIYQLVFILQLRIREFFGAGKNGYVSGGKKNLW